MLSIDVLNNKPINTINGQQIVDLTVSSISSSSEAFVKFVNIAMCPYEFEMRPDLFSKLYTGDQNNMGMLLKMNGISNPFSLEMGDVLLIPSLASMQSMLAKNTTSDGKSDRKDFVNKITQRVSKISSERKNYLEAKSISQNTPLPPNIAGDNDKQFVVKDGKIVLGGSIGTIRTSNAQIARNNIVTR